MGHPAELSRAGASNSHLAGHAVKGPALKPCTWLPTPFCLTRSPTACYLIQSHAYSLDPPTQTDGIFYTGWPRPYEHTAGFHDRYPAALAINIAIFLVPAALLGIATSAALRAPATAARVGGPPRS